MLNEHCFLLNEKIGKLPEKYRHRWTDYDELYDKNGVLKSGKQAFLRPQAPPRLTN